MDGDYLAWNTAQWDIIENVAVYEENICLKSQKKFALFMKKMTFNTHNLNCGKLKGLLWAPQNVNDQKSLLENQPSISNQFCSNSQQEIFVGHKGKLNSQKANEVRNWYTEDVLYPTGWNDNISRYPWVEGSEQKFLSLSKSFEFVAITMSLTVPFKFDYRHADYESCASCIFNANIPLIRCKNSILRQQIYQLHFQESNTKDLVF